jgi:hypothetical protein
MSLYHFFLLSRDCRVLFLVRGIFVQCWDTNSPNSLGNGHMHVEEKLFVVQEKNVIALQEKHSRFMKSVQCSNKKGLKLQ